MRLLLRWPLRVTEEPLLMTLDQLQQLVAEGESERLEFKKSTGELRGGMESLCGFLNGNGGRTVFGVTPAGKINGQDVTDPTLREIAEEMKRIDPPITADLERIELAIGRTVLILTTGAGPMAPYLFNGRPFRRVASTTSVMPQAEYQRRLLQRDHSRDRWENQPAVGYRVEDLDANEIRQTVTESVAVGRLLGPWTDAADTLSKFHMLVDDVPTQAAVIAFAIEPMPDYPQCALRLARFRGVTKDEFLDQNQLTGHAFLLLREAMLFLRRHLPVAGRFEIGVLERIDEPLFPVLALREAVVNALIHRDYAVYGGAVHVAIYDDRVEVISAGTLPFDLTTSDLTRDHESRPRNPHLADVFYRRGLIERWGRGTQKIVALCVAAGHPAPQFEERAGSLVVRFLVKGYVPPLRVAHDLTERQRRVLYCLRDGMPRICTGMMARVRGVIFRSQSTGSSVKLSSISAITGTARAAMIAAAEEM